MAKKRTILDLQQMKERGEQAAWMVIYDSCLASYAEEAGMDMILVGDSMGMIIYGYDGTVPVTMDMSIAHCQGVRRGAPNTYVIGDMPFGAYHASAEDAVSAISSSERMAPKILSSRYLLGVRASNRGSSTVLGSSSDT